MVAWTLAASALTSSVTAAVLITLGARLRQRATEPERRLAARAFGSTWILFGITAAVNTATTLATLAGLATVATVVTSRLMSLTTLTAAFASLSLYLVYIHGGGLRWYPPIVVGYTALVTGGWWAVFAANPTGVAVGAWYVEPAFGTLSLPLIYGVIAFGLAFTPLAVLASYLTLLRHVEDRGARTRVKVVSYGLLIWLTLTSVTRVVGNEFAFFTSRSVLALALGLAVWFVHFPPGWAATRFGLTPLVLMPKRTRERPLRVEISQRLRDLV